MLRAVLAAMGLGFGALVYSGAEKVPAAIELPAQPQAQTFEDIALPMIARFEGKRNKAYQDVVGVWTICYGQTRGVSPGDFKTDAECEAQLRNEVQEYREGMHAYFTPETMAGRLPVTRDAAYTSLAFNVGIAGAGKSTATKRLNAGDIAGGCEAIGWWNKAGGRVIRGLVLRRTEEVNLCLLDS